MPPSLPYTLLVIITISLVDPLLTTEQVEDEWVEYEVDSLFSSYKDFEPFDDNEELWHEDDYKEYEARSDDFFQSTSICQPIPSPIKDQYTSLIPSNDPTLMSTSTIGKSSLVFNTSGMSTPNSPAQKTISEVSKSNNAIPTTIPTPRIVVKQRRAITTSTPKLASQVPTTLATVKPTTIETAKKQTDKSAMMVSEIKVTSNTYKTITGGANTASSVVQSSCDCSKCNIVTPTISSDESTNNGRKTAKKRKISKPSNKIDTTEPETEVDTTTPETETEPTTTEQEPSTTEATEEQEAQTPKGRKRGNSASNIETTSMPENEQTAIQTQQGIKNNSKKKTTVKGNKRHHSPNLLSNETINFEAIKPGWKNNSKKQIHTPGKTPMPLFYYSVNK